MDKKVRQVIEKHHSFYEVMPYYVVVEEGHGTPAATTQRIQAGFDVDVYGIRTSDDPWLPKLSPDYALGYAGLLELVKTISSNCTDGCSIEVIPAGSTVILDTKNDLHSESMVRIEITHRRGLEQPAGMPEEQALEEVEKELQSMGVACHSGGPGGR